MKTITLGKRNMYSWLLWVFVCVIPMGILTSWGDDDDENDKDGVITVDSYYGATIDSSFFFHPMFSRAGIFSDDVVSEIGPVNGLEDITSIPHMDGMKNFLLRKAMVM